MPRSLTPQDPWQKQSMRGIVMEEELFYRVNDDLPPEKDGQEVLYLQRGDPYVWFIHSRYVRRFVEAAVRAGVVPVELDVEVGECFPFPIVPEQNKRSGEYTYGRTH